MSDYERVTVEDPTDFSTLPSKDNAEGDILDPGAGAAGVPLLGQANNIKSAIWGMAEGETDIAGGTMQVLASVADVAGFASNVGTDPLGALFGALVDILVPLIQPLEDLIHQVSGDPNGMRAAAEKWGAVSEADNQLSQALAETLTPLADWTGSDGDAARARIDDMAAGLFGLAKQCSNAQKILAAAQLLAEAIKEAIKWLLAKLIEFLVIKVVPQLAAASVTFGATAGTALVTASVEAARTTTKAVGFTQKIIGAMTELGRLVMQVVTSDLGGIIVASLQYTPGVLGNALNSGPGGEAATAGSGSGVDADPAVLEGVSPTVDMIAEDAAGVAEEVTAAAQDDLTWGLCGAVGFVTGYNGIVDEINSLHKDASTSLNQLATNISDCAEDWRTSDADAADLFANVETELQGGG